MTVGPTSFLDNFLTNASFENVFKGYLACLSEYTMKYVYFNIILLRGLGTFVLTVRLQCKD